MTSFHPAANLTPSLDIGGAVASLMGGQKESGQGVFNAVLKNCLHKPGNQTSATASLNPTKSFPAGNGDGSADGPIRSSLTIKGFLDLLEPLSPVMGMLKVPPRAVPALKTVLESLGITAKEASSLIQTASDSEGFVRLDRLWVRLKAKAATGEGGQETPSVPLNQLPVVAQMLSAMGMESEQVKALIEKAANGEGGLDSQALLKAVKAQLASSGAVPGSSAETAFSRGLALLQSPTEHGLLAKEPQLVSLMKSMAEDPTLAQQERIKQEIGALLQEKGIPPQDVKAFLENLSVAQAKDLLKATQGLGPDGPSGGVSTLMSQVKVDSEKTSAQAGDTKKILDILGNENVGLKDPAEKKGASSGLSSGSRPPGATHPAEANGGGVAAKKTDHNGSPTPNGPVQEAVPQTNGEAIQAGGKSVMAGGVELPGAAGPKHEPPPPVEPTLRVPVTLPEPLPKILDRMVWMVQGGVQKTTVELSPPELGRIQLNLVIENGQIRGVMGTENPMVKDLIDSNLSQLRAQLESLGFSVQSFEVTAGLNQHQRPDHGSAWQHEQPATGGGLFKDEKGVGSETVGNSYGGYSDDGHQINLRV